MERDSGKKKGWYCRRRGKKGGEGNDYRRGGAGGDVKRNPD